MESSRNKPSENPDPRDLGFYYSLANVGMEMVIPTALGLVVDHYVGTMPWITIVLTVFGFVGGLVHLVVLLQMKAKKDEESGRQP